MRAVSVILGGSFGIWLATQSLQMTLERSIFMAAGVLCYALMDKMLGVKQ